jgi:hypothetical protein
LLISLQLSYRLLVLASDAEVADADVALKAHRTLAPHVDCVVVLVVSSLLVVNILVFIYICDGGCTFLSTRMLAGCGGAKLRAAVEHRVDRAAWMVGRLDGQWAVFEGP